MGISKAGAKILLKEHCRRPFSGRALTLGKQDVHFSFADLESMASTFGVHLSENATPCVSLKPEYAAMSYLSDDSLFRLLGCSKCDSLDSSSYESASFLFDLNRPELPACLVDQYDVIFDGGTLEHIFHVPNVLNNIYAMLRQGGRIIHIAPSSNHIDHGFYMFSPTLFWDYYCANNYQLNSLQLIRHTTRPHTDLWEISDYTPGCLAPVSFGGLDDGLYAISCIATKTQDSTGNLIPQQGSYLNTWLATGSVTDIDNASNAEKQMALSATQTLPHGTLAKPETRYCGSFAEALTRGVKAVSRRVPPLHSLLRYFHKSMSRLSKKRKGLGLEVIARY